jgi:hypothetical protein
MIVKLLGIIDILAAILFWIFGFFGLIPKTWIMLFAFYLLIKGAVFLISADVASILDIIVAMIMFLATSFPLPKAVYFIVVIFLLQKGFFSVIS